MEGMTEFIPKCLVELNGRPLLSWQIDALTSGGVSEIAVVTGYRYELLGKFGLQNFYNPRWAQTNMVSSLECASKWLSADDCIVSYSDIFYKSSAVTKLLATSAELAITYDPGWLSLWSKRFENPLNDAESFRIDTKGFITEIGHKSESVHDIQGQYMGLLKFSPSAWGLVQSLRSKLPVESCDSQDMTSLLQALIKCGVALQGVPYSDGWGEVDSPSDLAVYDSLNKDNR